MSETLHVLEEMEKVKTEDDEFSVQVTEWYPTKKGLQFAVEQLEKYDDHCVFKEKYQNNEVSYAVFRKAR